MTNDKQKEQLVELLEEADQKVQEYILENDHMDWIPKLKELSEVRADFLLSHGVVVPPCKVGDKFYKVERWCTEGGYWEKPRYAYSSTCEDCCEECDGKDEIVEYTFNSPQQILSLEKVFGKYVFLTREEAEKALGGVKG